MTAETTTCNHCGQGGHLTRNFWKKRDEDNQSGSGGNHHDNKRKNKKSFGKKGGSKTGSKGAAGQKWCSVHKTTVHSDDKCYAQGAPRPKRGGVNLASAVLTASSPPVNDDDNAPSLNFNDDFDKGCARSAVTTANGGRISGLNSENFTMLVDSGASDHFVDEELVPGLRQRMRGLKILDEPKPIETAGNKKCFATAQGNICGHIINPSGKPIPVRIFASLVPEMGRHLFSSVTAMKSGVTTILRAGNPQLQFNKDTSLPLNQHGEHAGVCSFDLSLPTVDGKTLGKMAVTGVTETSSTPGMALAARVSADTWHRRLGHMNPRNMELFRKTEGNGVEYTGTVSGCGI